MVSQIKWLKGIVTEKTGPVSYQIQVGDRVWRRHVDQMLNTGSEARERNVEADDYLYPPVETEQPRQNEEQHPTDEESDPPAPQDEPIVTEPPENNSQAAAGTARYPKRSRNPPEYLRLGTNDY